MLIDKLFKRVEALGLNLQGKTVLTEAASGAYVVTPLLAAIAGAKVYAFTRTTKYGTTAARAASASAVPRALFPAPKYPAQPGPGFRSTQIRHLR